MSLNSYAGTILSMIKGLSFKIILVIQVVFVLLLFGANFLIAKKVDSIIYNIEQIKGKNNGEKDG